MSKEKDDLKPPGGFHEHVYICLACAARGVRLWRPINPSPDLRCHDCAEKETAKSLDRFHCIGKYVPAVPHDTGVNRFYSFIGKSKPFFNWWLSLPLRVEGDHPLDEPFV